MRDRGNFYSKEFGYDLSKSCDEIRPEYYFDVSCQGTVPQAITAFLEGKMFGTHNKGDAPGDGKV